MAATKIDRDLLVDKKGAVSIHAKVPYHVKQIIKILVEKGDYFSISTFCHQAIMDKIKAVIASYSSLASSDVDEAIHNKVELLAGLDTDKIIAIRQLLDSAAALFSAASNQ